MNVGEWVDAGLTLRGWKPSEVATEFKDDAKKMFQLCLDKIAGDAPQAFVSVQERAVLLPQYLGTKTGGILLSTTADPYVLKFTPNTALASPPRPYPNTDGTWDGIYHLEFTTSDKVIHRRQCREFWKVANLATADDTYYVSLLTPFVGTATSMEFRLYTPEFFLRSNITRVEDGVLFTGTRERVFLRPNFFSNRRLIEDINGLVVGRPEFMVRGRHFQLQAPTRTPVLDLIDENWLGPEAPGTFSYRYTYVWGKKDSEYLAPGGASDPQWESAPSPESNKAVSLDAGPTIRVTMPNIDWMSNFGDAATLRYGHSGLRKRIYRARYTATAGGTLPIEEDGVYHFIQEVDGLTTTWTDNGTVIPDYLRRLPEINGYYAYSMYPYQNIQYEVDLRCFRRPERLFHDQDAPEVEAAAESALMCLFLSKLALLDKKIEESVKYEADYKEEIGTFVKIMGVRARTLPQEAYQGRRSGAYYSGILPGSARTI